MERKDKGEEGDDVVDPAGDADESIWEGKAKTDEGPTAEEEFEDYFTDMFM